MGVSLQRVQSKFACIIGELCNEPEILSQFTIWVDLRISEYKANGTIALDCSGICPNPAWLEGFKPVLKADDKKPMHGIESCAKGESSNSENFRQRFGSNESPLLVISSDGGSDEDFDWSNESRRSSDFPGKSPSKSLSQQRKRSPSSTLGSNYCRQPFSVNSPPSLGRGATPSKVPRFDLKAKWNIDGTKCAPASPALPQPINESLISIIQDEKDDLTDLSDASVIFDDFEDEFTQLYGSERLSAVNGSHVTTKHDRRKSSSQRSVDDAPPMPDSLSNLHIRMRINTEGKTEQIIRNMIHSVSSFQHWIWKKSNDLRHIETMPVSLLSMYLSDFFTNLKKPNGKNYGAVGFANIKTQIERFLSEKQYPYSITNSPELLTVREIFEKRRQHLKKRRKQPKVKDDSSSADEQDPVWSDIDQEEPDLSIKQILLVDDSLAPLETKETQTLS